MTTSMDNDIKRMEEADESRKAGKRMTTTEIRTKLLRAIHANLLFVHDQRNAGADKSLWQTSQIRAEAFGDCLALLKPGWTLASVEVRVCAAPDCEVAFIPIPRRPDTRYHTPRCQRRIYMREYRREYRRQKRRKALDEKN